MVQSSTLLQLVMVAPAILARFAAAEKVAALKAASVLVTDVDAWGFPEVTAIKSGCKGTKGAYEAVACSATACANKKATCTPEPYKAGCCATPDANNTDCKPCGYLCPDNVLSTCESKCDNAAKCFTCPEEYTLDDIEIEYDCLLTGDVKLPGGRWSWAIGCGTDGTTHSCQAWRTGDGLTHEVDGLVTLPYSCEEIAANECDDPDDCPFDCSRKMCNAFQGIEWFLGNNFLNESLFVVPSSGVIDISTPRLNIGDKSVSKWTRASTAVLCDIRLNIDDCATFATTSEEFVHCVTEVADYHVQRGNLHADDQTSIVAAAIRSGIGNVTLPDDGIVGNATDEYATLEPLGNETVEVEIPDDEELVGNETAEEDGEVADPPEEEELEEEGENEEETVEDEDETVEDEEETVEDEDETVEGEDEMVEDEDEMVEDEEETEQVETPEDEVEEDGDEVEQDPAEETPEDGNSPEVETPETRTKTNAERNKKKRKKKKELQRRRNMIKKKKQKQKAAKQKQKAKKQKETNATGKTTSSGLFSPYFD